MISGQVKEKTKNSSLALQEIRFMHWLLLFIRNPEEKKMK